VVSPKPQITTCVTSFGTAQARAFLDEVADVYLDPAAGRPSAS
jgi:hypothetical protein